MTEQFSEKVYAEHIPKWWESQSSAQSYINWLWSQLRKLFSNKLSMSCKKYCVCILTSLAVFRVSALIPLLFLRGNKRWITSSKSPFYLNSITPSSGKRWKGAARADRTGYSHTHRLLLIPLSSEHVWGTLLKTFGILLQIYIFTHAICTFMNSVPSSALSKWLICKTKKQKKFNSSFLCL